MDAQEQSQKSEETQSSTATESPSQPQQQATPEGPRAAKLPITIAFLESLLPKETRILSVTQNDARKTVDVVITHPSFTPLRDGELPPEKTLLAYKGTHIDRMEYQG